MDRVSTFPSNQGVTNLATGVSCGSSLDLPIQVPNLKIASRYQTSRQGTVFTKIRNWTINGTSIYVLKHPETEALVLAYVDPITKIRKQSALILKRPSSWEENENEFFKKSQELIQTIFFNYFSPLIENDKIIFAEPDYECSFNGRCVRFFQLQDEVVYQYNNQQGSVPIDKESLPITLQIAYIKACLVRISDQGVLSITPKLHVIHQWAAIPNCCDSVSLVKEEDHFIWEVNCLGDNTFHLLAEEAPNIPIEDMSTYLGNFNVQACFKNNQLSAIKLEKISAQSYLDPAKQINPDVWAVTLIDTGTSSRSASTFRSFQGHSMIVIEGVRIPKDSKRACHFMELADLGGANLVLGGVGTAKVRFFSDSQENLKHLHIRDQSQTFLVARQRVEKMVDNIKQQQNYPFEFNLLSRNCAFWAVKTLEMIGIKLSEPRFFIYNPKDILDKLIQE